MAQGEPMEKIWNNKDISVLKWRLAQQNAHCACTDTQDQVKSKEKHWGAYSKGQEDLGCISAVKLLACVRLWDWFPGLQNQPTQISQQQ